MQSGIIAAMVTPLNEDETIDTDSLEKLVERVISGGIVGIFSGGTMGEGPALRDMERYYLYRETVRIVNGRIPVMVNISDMGTMRSIDQLKMVIDAKVDYAVLTPRLGFPQRMTEETYRHVNAVASASKIPVVFYDNPVTTSVVNSFEMLKRISELNNVHGIKYSGNDRELFTHCVKELAVPVMTGNVSDIAYAGAIGSFGAIAGIACLAPKICREVFATSKSGQENKANELQIALNSIYTIYGQNDQLWPAAQKYVLKKLGIIRTSMSTAPFVKLGLEEERQINEAIDALDQKLFEV